MCKAPNGAGGDEQKALSRVTVRSTNENELDRPAVNFLWHTGLTHLFTTGVGGAQRELHCCSSLAVECKVTPPVSRVPRDGWMNLFN